MDNMLFQTTDQINGTDAHSAIDERRYSTKKNILQGISIYSEKYKLCGKIDILDVDQKLLTERKKKISMVYDGYIFQLYGQYFALKEMGYKVQKIRLYSMDDNKSHPVKLPEEDEEMLYKFEKVISDIKGFVPENFVQSNSQKCMRCIYEPACDRACINDDEHK